MLFRFVPGATKYLAAPEYFMTDKNVPWTLVTISLII